MQESAAEEEAEFLEDQLMLGDNSIMLCPVHMEEAENDDDINGALTGSYVREYIGGDHSPPCIDDLDTENGPAIARVRHI